MFEVEPIPLIPDERNRLHLKHESGKCSHTPSILFNGTYILFQSSESLVTEAKRTWATENVDVPTLLQDICDAVHEGIHVVLVEVVIVCIALSILISTVVWRIAGRDPHRTTYLLLSAAEGAKSMSLNRRCYNEQHGTMAT